MIPTIKEYIYIRRHENYDKYNVCKLGQTTNIPNRNSHYNTSEYIPGKFIAVYRITTNSSSKIETLLQRRFEEFHRLGGGGIEYYDIQIIDLIETHLNELCEYEKLSENDINDLIRTPRDKAIKIPSNSVTKYKPNELQEEVLKTACKFFKTNAIGKIIWCCGLGKTLMSLFISEELHFNTIVIGVPSCCLIKQWCTYVIHFFNKEHIFCLDASTSKGLKDFIVSDRVSKVIITTYASSYKIKDIFNDYDMIFDFKIGDEAHHLANLPSDSDKQYLEFHNINTRKSLFMTATEKQITNNPEYSMENCKRFGTVIDFKSIHWAIENKKITDYSLIVFQNRMDEINQIIQSININVSDERKELFLSAYLACHSFIQYSSISHILIFCNKTTDADRIKGYITELIAKRPEFSKIKDILYNKALHSKQGVSINEELKKFTNSKYGIISCVYFLGEGIDIPKLNGVIFSSNMESEIRIVQSALRPHRLEKTNPTKEAYIILPYIEKDDDSFEKIRVLVSRIGNIDENIESRITVFNNGSRPSPPRPNPQLIPISFIEDPSSLKLLKTRLKRRKALYTDLDDDALRYNEQCEINKRFNFKTVNEYQSNHTNNPYYIEMDSTNDESPLKEFGTAWKGWYDYLGINTTEYLQTKSAFVTYANTFNLTSEEDYYLKAEHDNKLPDRPDLFYPGFVSLRYELDFHEEFYEFSED